MKKAVVPGEKLGLSEEYIAHQGTYEDDGVIYAEKAGTMIIDEAERTVRVDTGEPLPGPPRKGDLVVGMVASTRSSMAMVEIMHSITNPRTIITEDYATLHISKISGEYHKDFSDAVAPGDIIKALVIEDDPAIRIKISSPELGVIKSTCINCGLAMERRGKVFRCETCDRDYKRKIARTEEGR
jgi:exosome complex component CSL4